MNPRLEEMIPRLQDETSEVKLAGIIIKFPPAEETKKRLGTCCFEGNICTKEVNSPHLMLCPNHSTELREKYDIQKLDSENRPIVNEELYALHPLITTLIARFANKTMTDEERALYKGLCLVE